MASTKFTKETLEVALKSIIYECNEALESLKETDVYDSLNGVDKRCEKIKNYLDDIAFRLQDCDEY